MNDTYLKSLITYTNLKYYGVDLTQLYFEAGEKIAQRLITEFGLNKKFIFVAGLGGNAMDGFSTAIALSKFNIKAIEIYIVGRANNLEREADKEILELLYKEANKKNSLISIKQDCYAKDILQGDIIIECLVGTGLEGSKLNKRFHDVINRISHFNSILVSIDAPAPSYKPDKVYSLIYPKTSTAEVIDLKFPNDINLYCGPGDAKYIFQPKKFSHKAKNGRMLIIADTNNIEALEQSVEIARQYEVFSYVYNLNKTAEVSFSEEFMDYYEIINDEQLDDIIENSDSIYYSVVDSSTLLNRSLINTLLNKVTKPQVISSSVLKTLDFDSIKEKSNIVLIPYKEEFIKYTNGKYSEFSVRSFAFQYKMNLIHIAIQTTLYSSNGEFKINLSGISLKSWYRHYLESLIIVLSTKNDLWTSIRAGIFILDLASNLSNENNNLIPNNIVTAIEQCREF